ncbi:UNVERIFIED_CONTAM: hypothetical protein Cloal_2711 [Acetivibrio alkalicellulosi]
MPVKRLVRVRLKNDKKLKRFIGISAYGLLRFFFYGMIGVFSEVCYYSIVRIGRMIPIINLAFKTEWRTDESLGLNAIWDTPWYVFFGQCSLWMLPVYGVCSMLVIEKLYRYSCRHDLHWIFRGTMYSISIIIFELIAGYILWWITGYQIWYYSDAGNIFKMTSIFLFFVWFVAGMLVEFIYIEFAANRVSKRLRYYIQYR